MTSVPPAADVLPYRSPRSAQERSAVLGMVVFLGSWAMMFASLFFAYAILRVRATAWPPVDLPRLPRGLPGLATGVIALSSVVLSLSLRAVRDRREVRGGWLSAFALVLGVVFVALQLRLWQGMVAQGLTPQTSAYASVFYGLTVFHALHVGIGVLGLSWVSVQTFRRRYTAAWHVPLRLWTTYWHFVGIVWLIMYVSVIVL